MNYLRFAFCLAFGLAGVSLFLMTMLDTLFCDIDLFAELRLWFRRLFLRDRRRYVHIENLQKYRVKQSSYEQEFLGGGGRQAFNMRRKAELVFQAHDA
ncbi:MAG: hypothetical protein ABIJ96_14075 [Elusimicrobiota bacterium]